MSKKTETKAPVEKEKLTGKAKTKKIIKIVLNTLINILIVVVLLTSIIIAALSLTSKNDPNGIPNVFGITFQYVQTNSMDIEPPKGYEGGNFSDQDVIIGKKYSEEAFPELKEGDIITYRSENKDDDGNVMMITHRIVDVDELYGETVYQTKGDAENLPDQNDVGNYLRKANIVSVNYSDNFHGKTLKGFAEIFRTIRTQKGFFLFIMLPMILFFLYAIVQVVISAMNVKKSKADEEKEEAEKKKQEEIDAAVAAALAEKDGAGEAKTETPADMTPEQMEEFKKFLAFKEAQKASAEAAPAEESPAEETPAEEAPAEE